MFINLINFILFTLYFATKFQFFNHITGLFIYILVIAIKIIVYNLIQFDAIMLFHFENSIFLIQVVFKIFTSFSNFYLILYFLKKVLEFCFLDFLNSLLPLQILSDIHL